ncbi:MAG: cysteine--tRNA ligase [Pseudomonadales bacterium]
MDLYLHDSQSGHKRRFEPADPARVTLYVCGPTVYNLVHIGNGRPAVVFDVLFRLLRALYANVVYARNITDIDDKINAAARAGGESIGVLTERYTAAYREDVDGLGVLRPTVEPCATGHIDEMLAMISTLIAKGHAYAADGHVLFHVPSDPDYGSLSHRTLEDMLDGARVDVAPYKRDPKDFVLWKPSPADLPGWESPWGRGRPGWHIECSAMILKHLGTSIDIHGGGSDLAFPHHENEAAQSRCANEVSACVRYWLHNGMLTLGAEKMSKSVGNIVTIRALREDWSGEVLRYALLSGHYRSQLVWSDDLLQQSATSLNRLYQAVRVAGSDARTSAAYADERSDALPESVLAALCDDLNTPLALAALHQLASEIHRTTDTEERARLRNALLAGGWLLGILTESADAHFSVGAAVDPAEIEQLIENRATARKHGDYAAADEIRQRLLARGIELEDTRQGTRWRVSETGV